MVAVRAETRGKILVRLAHAHHWRKGVELGVLKGSTFLRLLNACPELSLVGVDLWIPQPDKEALEGGRSYSSHDLDGYFARLQKETEPYGERAQLLRMSTVDAATHFPKEYFDFCFIDADHTYEGVKADIEAWLPKIRKGGWMMGHDYNQTDFPGVVRAVRERFGACQLFLDHVWGVEC